MYTRPIIFKIYSVVVIVFAILGFISSITQLFIPNNPLLSLIPNLNAIFTAIKIVSVITSMITLFFGYMEFSAMYTFADMIEYEKSNSLYPFQKKSFVLPAKFYKSFGAAIFYISLFVQFIFIIATVIISSIEKKAFISLPLIPIAISLLSLLLTYIIYYAKFKTFSDLLEIVSSKNITEKLKVSLKESKPNLLRGYCTFLFVVAILISISVLILIFVLFSPISALIGTLGALIVSVIYLILGAILFLLLSVIGCSFDNLAKMLEHYMIKYKLV